MGVKIKYKTKIDITKDMLKNMSSAKGRSVEVGCIKGDHAWLAGIHEYGCNITAKNGKYLTVPVHPEAVGKSAQSFSDLFVINTKKGNKFLARKSGRKGQDITLMYWLTESVKIPERSFLRNGHDEHIDEIIKKAEMEIGLVIEGKMSNQKYLDEIGEMLSTKIKDYATKLSDPPNSSITAETKGSSNPLKDTGSMIEGISWRVK